MIVVDRLPLTFLALICATMVIIGGCREGWREPAPTTAPTTNSGGKPGGGKTSGGDTVRMQIGGETFNLEVADTPAKHQRGLMARGSMPADHGMIFVFPEEAEREFWMKDTLIRLDILYLDLSGKVVSIKTMEPRNLTPVPSEGPAMYAIELNQGAAQRAGVKPGDTLTIPPEVTARRTRR